MELDWLKIGAVLQGVGGIMQGLGAGLLVWITWRGVSAWREELRSKRTQELAEETLSLAARLIDGIHHMRSPWVSAAELSAVPRPENIGEEEFDLRKTYLAIQRRFALHEGVHADLMTIRYRVAAVFGAGTKKHIDALLDVVNEVRNTVVAAFNAERELDALLDWRPHSGKPDRPDISKEIENAQARREKANAILFTQEEGKDQIAGRMREAMAALERKLVPFAQLAN
ncbi:hypothetical protein [Xanthomonas sacchari]|uniref:hypothetical protein n=1 Tax=Xanthomonas sacchari TaxID=56458 RepID=UPI00225E614E|nr:hypothetical protein [Xanthomonas sacchari]